MSWLQSFSFWNTYIYICVYIYIYILQHITCRVPYMFLFQFSRSVVSDSSWPRGLQHARLPYPSPTPEACSNSCSSSRWCRPTIFSSVIPFSWLQSLPASFLMSQFFTSGGQNIGVFSFGISPSNEYSGLISFRIDRFDLLAVQGTRESLLQYPQFRSINSSAPRFL